jgi:large subunit ribosomal protein L27
MAQKKSGSASKNGRDSNSKRLGIKASDGQFVKAGNIIVRQRGTKLYPGVNSSLGSDYTIFSLTDGIVKFRKTKHKTFVDVLPLN